MTASFVAPRSADTAPHAPLSVVPTSVVPTPSAPAQVSPAPVTISGGEMARLTGVDRERLRTWERRHGFPEPVRSRNDVRRYRVEDVRRVAAISQLAAAGVPLREAIERVLTQGDDAAAVATLGALDHAPSPALAISGPTPLTVSWVNGATARHPESPIVGDDVGSALPALGTQAGEVIRQLFSAPTPAPAIITHVDWTGSFPVPCRSVAWRLEGADGHAPVVLLMQLPESAAAAPTPAAAPVNQALQQQAAVWAGALAAARRALQTQDGLASAQRSIGALAAGAGAADGFLALGRGAQLRVATSVRSSVASRVVDRSACPDISAALSDHEVDWLAPATIRALGINPNAAAVAIPLVAAGEHLGVAVLTFRDELALGDTARELLLTFGLSLGATLLRERAALPAATVPARLAA